MDFELFTKYLVDPSDVTSTYVIIDETNAMPFPIF